MLLARMRPRKPYHHAHLEETLLKTAIQLIGEVGPAGFTLREVATQGQAEPLDRLKVAGLAYIEFALRRPEHFAVMFDAPVAKRTSSDHAEAAEEAFGTLLAFVKACQDKRQLPAGDTLQFTLLAWTMVHGIAKLATAKRLPFDSRAGILKFATFVIDQSLPTAKETLTKRSKDAK